MERQAGPKGPDRVYRPVPAASLEAAGIGNQESGFRILGVTGGTVTAA